MWGGKAMLQGQGRAVQGASAGDMAMAPYTVLQGLYFMWLGRWLCWDSRPDRELSGAGDQELGCG